jgi:hypothetical protein
LGTKNSSHPDFLPHLTKIKQCGTMGTIMKALYGYGKEPTVFTHKVGGRSGALALWRSGALALWRSGARVSGNLAI